MKRYLAEIIVTAMVILVVVTIVGIFVHEQKSEKWLEPYRMAYEAELAEKSAAWNLPTSTVKLVVNETGESSFRARFETEIRELLRPAGFVVDTDIASKTNRV